MSFSRLAAAAVLCALACGRAQVPQPPQPQTIVPRAARTIGDVRVVIGGASFALLASRRLGQGISVEGQFRAWLGNTELSQVAWVDGQTLEAVVPAGLSGNGLDLTVEGPTGRGTLPGAFRASTVPPPSLSVALSGPARVEAGKPFQVRATVSNGNAEAVSGMSISLASLPGLTVDSAAAQSASDVIYSVRASVVGALPLTASVVATDVLTGGSVTASSPPLPAVVLAGPALRVVARPLPAAISVGQAFTAAADVFNDGDADATAVRFAAPSSPAVSPNGAAAGPQDVPAGQVRTFTWPLAGAASGPLDLTSTGSGTDSLTGLSLPLQVAWNHSVVQRPATLSFTSFTLRSSLGRSTINRGQAFTAALTIANTGEAGASGVLPRVPAATVTGGASAATSSSPPAQAIAGGASATFTWSYVESGTSAGTLQLATTAAGTDANSGATVTLGSSASETLAVQAPALLSAALTAPASVVANQTFTVTLGVVNSGGGTVNGLAPTAFALTGPAVVTSGPTPASATLAGGGQTVTFTWNCQANATGGSIGVTASAAGTDANDGSARWVDATTSTTVSEVAQLSSNDPFGDGTSFAQLFDFNGRIYLGPGKTGNAAVRMLPDGTMPEKVTFSIAGDTGAFKNANSSPAPYPSLGYSGCAQNTAQCGPDNEDGRGLFTSGLIAGTPWLIAAGSRSGASLLHIYLTPDTGTALGFDYIGMGKVMGGDLEGASALAIFHDRIYLGFASNKSVRPFLTMINRTPVPPGYDTSAVDQVDLAAAKMPGIGASAATNPNPAPAQGIDSIFGFNDLLYLGNNGGWMRSTNNNPAAYSSAGTDWAVTTPSAAAYPAKASLTTTKIGDLTPADRALPAMAAIGGKLYAARNTTTGPQLWVCTPGASLACDPSNWSLLAPNTIGDTMLTQFNDATNTAVTLLAASSSHLFVGFDNGGGLRLYRSGNAAPASLADFTGQGGCSASSTSCAGLGGNGLGAGLTRIFDFRALTYNGRDYLYLTAGTGTAGVRAFRTGG